MGILCVSSRTPCLVENGEIWFITQRKWDNINTMATSKWAPFCFLPGVYIIGANFEQHHCYKLKLFVRSAVFGTREDVQTKKMSSLFSLKDLSNRHRLFFTLYEC